MSGGELDRAAVMRAFNRAAASYDECAKLQREVCARLLARLDYIKLSPQVVLDVGTGTGQAAFALAHRYRAAHVVGYDIAEGMLRRAAAQRRWRRRPAWVLGDAQHLALCDASVDLLVSASTFQWCPDPRRLFGEIARVLRPHGALLFSSFGPDTLIELRAAWAQVDDGVHVHDLLDMHVLGDAMLRAGLSDPVVDAEWLRVQYRDLGTLLRDLKAIGASNASPARRAGLHGRAVLTALEAAYPRDAQGLFTATYEVIYGHAWAHASDRAGGRAPGHFRDIQGESRRPRRGRGGDIEVTFGRRSR